MTVMPKFVATEVRSSKIVKNLNFAFWKKVF